MRRPAIGTVLPSSNRMVERVLAEILALLPAVDGCVARIPYWGQGLGQPADGYDLAGFREAARLLGHAGVGVVCWNGTRGAALGLAQDEALARAMAEAAGCPGITTAMATVTVLARLRVRRVGMVAQGPMEEAAAHAAGLPVEVAGLRGLGIRDNAAASAVEPGAIAASAREVAAGAEAVLIWSTNLPGLGLVPALEAELGVPVLDSASIGVWACLDALGVDKRPASGLGRLFSLN
jgi:maleate isomerase